MSQFPPPGPKTPMGSAPQYGAAHPGGMTGNYPGGPMSGGYKLSDDDRLWGMLAHLLGWIGAVIGLVAKKDSPFVQEQAKESLNFQLTMLIVTTISCVTIIGPFIIPFVAIVFQILGGVAAYKGEHYRYPFNWRMIT